MITQFPYEFDTRSGYKATVNSPQPGHYHIEIEGHSSLDWYESPYKKPFMLTGNGNFSHAEREVMNAFWQLMSR